ncbi:MAG: response regulator [Paraglaciecola sp.]|nr:response regulator [Paraglaciecola sp.]
MKKVSLYLTSIMFVLLFYCMSVFATEAELHAVLDKVEANLLVNKELAKKLLSHADGLLEELPQSKEGARLLNLQAQINILDHQLSEAFANAKKAEQLALSSDNKLQLAEAIRKQGIISFLLDFDADALELLTRSLSLHQKLNSDYVLNNLQAIGNVYARNTNWAESLIEIGEELVEKAIIRQNSYYEEQGYGFIISGLINQESYAKASEVASQALAALENEGMLIYYYAAKAESKLNYYQSALAYIDQQLSSTQNQSTPLINLSSKLLKAEILMLDNQYSTALPILQDALNQANEINFSTYQKEALYKLANYYQLTGDAVQALDYFKQYEALKEQDLHAKQTKQLAFSRARLEVEQKNQHITELELSRQLAQQQNTYQLYFMVLSCAIILLLIFMYRRTALQKRVLSQYSRELKSASEAKSEFLARMSHEIRTPINAIIGLTKLSQKSLSTPRQQAINLQQIEESSKTLLGVINDVLDFSKIEAGKLDICHADFELDKVIEQAMRMQFLKAQEKNLEFNQYIAKDVPFFLNGDALRVQQVLNNLLSNAVKFTKQGTVSISVNKKYAESGITLEFAIKDTGIGLTEEQLGRLFDAFTQADESITRRFGGTGLGLTICKQLVELMGGKIWAESRIGQGSTFYFTINVQASSATAQGKALSHVQLTKLKVLVVDDVELSRQAAASALLRLNINPDVAENGAIAIEKIRLAVETNTPYQVIILDWKMPDISGIEVASIVQQEFSPKPQIIMLSAYDLDILQDLGRPLGIEGYLQKPVNSSSLLNALLQSLDLQKSPMKTVVQRSNLVPDLSDVKVLLVEDNELNRKVAKGYLADTRADVSVAENGQIALQMLREHPSRYGLILMDIQMPVMDGLIATQKIRTELQLQTPIVAMTAQAMAGDVDKSLAVGMNAHVIKPLDPDYLYRVLHKVLAPRNVVQALALTAGDGGHLIYESLTNIDTASAMHQLRVDEKTYWELVGDFINLEEQLIELQQALDENDSDKISSILHVYGPALSYIGAYGLAELAVQIQAALKNVAGYIPEQNLVAIKRFQHATLKLIATLKQNDF